MINSKMFLLLSLLLITIHCTAQTTEKDPIDVDYENCIGKDTSGSTISNCVYIAYGKWQSELDKYYDRIMKKLVKPKDKSSFKQAENAWLAYRSAEFSAYDNMFNKPGGNWYVLRLNSRVNVIRERVQQLRDYYEALDEKSKEN